MVCRNSLIQNSAGYCNRGQAIVSVAHAYYCLQNSRAAHAYYCPILYFRRRTYILGLARASILGAVEHTAYGCPSQVIVPVLTTTSGIGSLTKDNYIDMTALSIDDLVSSHLTPSYSLLEQRRQVTEPHPTIPDRIQAYSYHTADCFINYTKSCPTTVT